MNFIRPISFLLGLSLSVVGLTSAHAQTPAFTKLIIFGDSLSDVGNVHHQTEAQYFFGYPGDAFNYSDGRFTNSSDTDPGSHLYAGVWHEQLARTFLHLPVPTNSLDGGSDYAFGGATTKNGTSERTVISNPDPFIGGSSGITIDNMGRQVDRYLNEQTVDPSALYIVWGGGNDLFDDRTPENVVATSTQVIGILNRLVAAGARNFLVPNVPPLGGVPLYSDNPGRQIALNNVSAAYRDRLNADLDAADASFAAQGIDAKVYRLDIWSLFIRFTSVPAVYVFTDITHSVQDNSSADPDKYLFWDGIHPTTAAHFQIAKAAADVLSGVVPNPARALNVASRVNVEEGENIAIGGFIINGTTPKRVIVRGIGPSLDDRVPGALRDPELELFDHDGLTLGANDNWQDSQAADIQAAGLAPTDPMESAIIRTLPPGSYTAVLKSTDASTGIGVIEIYDLDSGTDSTLANLSTRGFVGTGDNVLIGGLIIGDGDSPIVVLRAIGPTLANNGIANPLQDPILELYDENGTQIGLNDNWKDGQPSAAKGALLNPSDDRESTLVVSLSPGHYTAVVRGKDNSTGVALVEAFRIP